MTEENLKNLIDNHKTEFLSKFSSYQNESHKI